MRRRKRKDIPIFGFLLFFLLLILLLISTRVNKITFLGNRQYSNEELKKLIFSEDLDYNSAYAFVKEYMSGNLYFDGDGIVVESIKKKLPGIPKITGLKFSKVSLYKTLPVEDKAVFRDILNLSASLKAENLECDHIDYDAMSNATLYMGDIKVLLGNNEDMEQKLSSLKDILPALSGRKGTLDLTKYRGRKEKEAYVFREEK